MENLKIMNSINNLFNRTPKENETVYGMLYFGCLDIFFDNGLDKNMSNKEIDNFFDNDIRKALSAPTAKYWYEYKPLVKQAFNKLLMGA